MNIITSPKENINVSRLVIFKMNADIIFTKVCPAIILADNRIAKLKDLIIYENTSITMRSGNSINGHSGINIFKKLILCKLIPVIKIPSDKDNDIHKIIIK